MTVLLAFTLDDAARVTGLTQNRIRYWDKTGVIKPSLSQYHQGGAYDRIYSFRDLVALRTVAELRDRFALSLQALRQVGDRLRSQYQTPWSKLRFYVSDSHLYYRDPETRLVLSALNSGQAALVGSLNLESVARDIERRADVLVDRAEDELGAIVKNRYVFGNQAVIAGTRIPTAAIWEFHKSGYTAEEILREYPRLTSVDIANALVYEERRRQSQRAA